jgi:hypothetical protein
LVGSIKVHRPELATIGKVSFPRKEYSGIVQIGIFVYHQIIAFGTVLEFHLAVLSWDTVFLVTFQDVLKHTVCSVKERYGIVCTLQIDFGVLYIMGLLVALGGKIIQFRIILQFVIALQTLNRGQELCYRATVLDVGTQWFIVFSRMKRNNRKQENQQTNLTFHR